MNGPSDWNAMCLAVLVLCAGCIEDRAARRSDDESPSRERREVTVSKAEPDPSCRPVGVFEGRVSSGSIPEYEVALARFREKAGAGGADYAVIDVVRQPGPNLMIVGGRGFDCSVHMISVPAAELSFTPETISAIEQRMLCKMDSLSGYEISSGRFYLHGCGRSSIVQCRRSGECSLFVSRTTETMVIDPPPSSFERR